MLFYYSVSRQTDKSKIQNVASMIRKGIFYSFILADLEFKFQMGWFT